ncbi:hypothetical protein NKG05_27595 [Oerskovia sp. M15]
MTDTDIVINGQAVGWTRRRGGDMGGDFSRRAVWGVMAIGVLSVTGCAPDRNIDVVNGAAADVTVRLGDEDIGEVSAGGGSSSST